MRKKIIGLFVIGGISAILLVPTFCLVGPVGGQQGGGGKKGGGKKGGPGGGDPNNPFGGGGGGKKGGKNGPGGGNPFGGGAPGGGMGMNFDPDALFNMLSQGGDAIDLSTVPPMMQGMVNKYIQQSGNTSGYITRDEFTAAAQNAMAGRGVGGAANFDPEKAAIAAFQRADKNSDGKLNLDEMPNNLKTVWQMFDTNKDGFIDLEEYKVFYRDTVMQRGGAGGFGAGAVLVEIEDIDKLPEVYRFGRLPPDLMAGGRASWFSQYDTDKDGQVGMWEWKESGKSIKQFQDMDRNGDGLLTPEEVLWYINKSITNGTLAEMPSIAQMPGAQGNNRGPGMGANMNPGMQKQKGKKGGGPGGNPFDPNQGGGGPGGKGGKGGKKGGGGGPPGGGGFGNFGGGGG